MEKTRVFLASVFPEKTNDVLSSISSSFVQKNLINSFVRFHFCPRENEREKRGKEGKRRDATVFWSLDLENGGNRGGAATKTHLPASRNEFVGCHSTGRTRLNPISSAAHLSL